MKAAYERNRRQRAGRGPRSTTARSGFEVDTLRSMMTKETWFTGREALEKGFADAIKEDEDDPEMSMSADRKVLFVNGVRHNVDGLQHVPGTIPVKAIATPPGCKARSK